MNVWNAFSDNDGAFFIAGDSEKYISLAVAVNSILKKKMFV